MTYVYILLVILVVGMVSYIYISKNPQDYINKKKKDSGDDSIYRPVDEFLAEPEPVVKDEPKVIFLGDIEAEKAKRNKKKD